METRFVSLTLDKAKEFYNSGSEALKEVALQAFTEEELESVHYTNIKTFEDAYLALHLTPQDVYWDLHRLSQLGSKLGNHLTALYKLDIIRKALNGDWKPDLIKGNTYYSWVRFYLPSKKPSDKKTIASLKVNNQEYLLVGGFITSRQYDGLSDFVSGAEYGSSVFALGLLGCKSAEIAQYMSEQFGKIIFDACFAQHTGSYEWL